DRAATGAPVGGRVLAVLRRFSGLVAAAVPPEGSEPEDRFDLYDSEPALEEMAAPVEGELARAVGMLLRPHVHGRLRSLELLGPILRRTNGAGANAGESDSSGENPDA